MKLITSAFEGLCCSTVFIVADTDVEKGLKKHPTTGILDLTLLTLRWFTSKEIIPEVIEVAAEALKERGVTQFLICGNVVGLPGAVLEHVINSLPSETPKIVSITFDPSVNKNIGDYVLNNGLFRFKWTNNIKNIVSDD